ncbi:PH domain-containing protein [Longispora sp. NPDC051575]|uniref:PH domain-containing protein n=1 Tax=Longispora sp. NPDC051575 TaxID=3154943 RepID=UPI00341C2B99
MDPLRSRPDLTRVASPGLEPVKLLLVVALLGTGLVAVALRTTVWSATDYPELPYPVVLMFFPVATVAVWLFRRWFGGRPPARLVAHRDGFAAPPAGYARARRLLAAPTLVAWYSLLSVGSGRRVATGWLVLFALAGLVALVGLLRPGPRVLLTPTGVEFRTWWRTRWTPWDEITAVRFRLSVEVRGRGWWSIPDERLDVWPGYTSDAIGHYLGAPGHRHLIGTAGELDRLHRELSATWARRDERIRRTGRWSTLLWPPAA